MDVLFAVFDPPRTVCEASIEVVAIAFWIIAEFFCHFNQLNVRYWRFDQIPQKANDAIRDQRTSHLAPLDCIKSIILAKENNTLALPFQLPFGG
jgi:hypothetical protein